VKKGKPSVAAARGRVNAHCGALIMSVVANGCTKLGLSSSAQEIVTGGIIIAAGLPDHLRRRGEQKP
jgi:ribose transport system permease protein